MTKWYVFRVLEWLCTFHWKKIQTEKLASISGSKWASTVLTDVVWTSADVFLVDTGGVTEPWSGMEGGTGELNGGSQQDGSMSSPQNLLMLPYLETGSL